MTIQSFRATSYPTSSPSARGNGPDDVPNEFDNGRSNDGPDAIYDEFDNSRGRDSGYNNYDSWGGGGYDGGGTTYGGLI